MPKKPLLVLDFDGVIIDGMSEYWNSSKKACLNLLKDKINFPLPDKVPTAFQYLRPWVHHGWEMILIAAELTKPNSNLGNKGLINFSKNYHKYCKEALKEWQWSPTQLQEVLDNVRKEDIKIDLRSWLNSHKPFPGISNQLKQLQADGLELVVLTTKSTEFTKELLNFLNININLIYGHETGSKVNTLIELSKNNIIQGFIEDRRETLEKVLNTSELDKIPCYLASWGYIKPDDLKNLPKGISLLELKTFTNPLAKWN